MDIKKYINYDNYIIPVDKIMQLSITDLEDLYNQEDTFYKYNIFFILLNEYIILKEQKLVDELAHVCYLLSYYLFIPLTPPASEELAEFYAKEAIYYNGIDKYKDWLKYLKEGN